MSFNIVLSSPNGDLFPMPVTSNTSILEVKNKLSSVIGVSAAQLQVSFNGQSVSNNETLEGVGSV